MDAQQMAKLIKVATGAGKADLVIAHGSIVNVYTGELLKGCAVAIKGERIACIGTDVHQSIGADTQVIDATGKILVPGFIDSHTHMSPCSVDEFLRYSVRGGTTTVVTEIMEAAYALGYRGILEILESCKNQPVKVFGVIPSMVSLSSRFKTGTIHKEQFGKLLRRDDILGLGETYWLPVVERDKRLLELFEKTLEAGKIISGHSAGAKGNKLAAYIAGGVSSCHEPISAEEVLERLRLGMYVLAREGETRKDLEAIAKIKDMGVDLHQLALVSDSTPIRQVIEEGYMDVVLKKAIALGFDPITAIQMVTINPARGLKLDDRLGGIAPGKFADIVIMPDLREISAEYVISSGRVVAKDGELVVHPRKHIYPAWMRHNIRLAAKFTPEDFIIAVPGAVDFVKARVIEQVAELVTREGHRDVPVKEGRIEADPQQDLLKVIAVDFSRRGGTKFVGLIKGFGMNKGAIASSAAWDLTNIIAVGADDGDLALAVNRIVQMQGGAVVCAGGRVFAELPLPIGGFLTDIPLERLLQRTTALQCAAADLGSTLPNTHLTLITLTSPAIPFFRICEEGLVDIRTNKMDGLFVDLES